MHENESDKSRQEGHVVKFDGDRGFGFIKADNDKSGEDIFFSRRDLTTRGQLPKVRDRVEFSVTKDIVDGRKKAIDIFVQVNVYVKKGSPRELVRPGAKFSQRAL